MTAWTLYDYVDVRGDNAFKDWTLGLEKKELAKLNQKLDMLVKNPGLPPGLLTGPLKGYPHLYVMKIKGSVQLRPFLCKGPVDKTKEFTLLFGATEKDFKYIPENAWDLAEECRLIVEKYPSVRRCDHDRVG